MNPEKMPALPPAMGYIGQHRPPGTKVIASVGGEAYSDSAKWPWLDSVEAAEAMAAEVVQWKHKFGIDGIDLDIEGNQPGDTAFAFAQKLKALDSTFIVTQVAVCTGAASDLVLCAACVWVSPSSGRELRGQSRMGKGCHRQKSC